MKTKDEIMVKPYSISELSQLYGVSVKTFKKWLHPIKRKVGTKHGRFYTVKQIQTLFQHFGLPYPIEIKQIKKKKLKFKHKI